MSDAPTPDEAIALQNELDSLRVMYELGLPPSTADAIVAAPGTAAKIELGQRLAAGQPAAAAAAVPATASPAPSQARPARDGRGRFSPAAGGFGGGVAPSGQPFSGHPPGENPADNAIRTAAGF